MITEKELFLNDKLGTMNYTKQVSRFFVLMLLIPLASCIKNGDFDFSKVKDIVWNPKFAMPLVTSDLSIMDLIKRTTDSSNFKIDNNGFVTLVYKNRLFSVNPASILTIAPYSYSASHTFTEEEATTISTLGTFTIPFEQDIKLTPADSIRIDSLTYGQGDLTLTISGTVINDGAITISIPHAKKNGIPLTATFTLANGSKTIDLSGYNFDLTKVAGKPSTFKLFGSITITNSPPGSIAAGKTINFNFEQHTGSIKVLSGYLGRFYFINENQTTDINLFKNAISASKFILVNPYFIFTFHNSIGIPLNLRFTEIIGKSNENGQMINLIPNPGVPNPYNVIGPLYTDTNPVKVSTVRIDNVGTNGAISNLLNLLKPGNLIYSFSGLTNPNGEQTENFLRDSSKLNVDVEFGLPLYGLIENFVIQDTLDFKFDNINEVENMLLRTLIENDFPLDAKIQVYFTDSKWIALDSLVTSVLPVDQIIIPAAQVNLSTGELISSAKKTSDFIYPKTRINKIVNAQKILVKAVLNSAGSAKQNVKIYNTYKLKVKIAAQVELKKKI